MEHNIGEVFEDNGVKLKVEKPTKGCYGCCFWSGMVCHKDENEESCGSKSRKDHNNIIFVKVNNNKDMETRNIKLDLKTAKEWFKGSDETLKKFALQAYNEEELKDNLPNSWEEFCEQNPVCKGECCIWEDSTIISAPFDTYWQFSHDRNSLPSEKSAEAHIALMQLEQLRDCYRGGWVPDWESDTQSKYVIYNYRNKVKLSVADGLSQFLSFPTIGLCTKFYDNFKDLIETAKDLI